MHPRPLDVTLLKTRYSYTQKLFILHQICLALIARLLSIVSSIWNVSFDHFCTKQDIRKYPGWEKIQELYHPIIPGWSIQYLSSTLSWVNSHSKSLCPEWTIASKHALYVYQVNNTSHSKHLPSVNYTVPPNHSLFKLECTTPSVHSILSELYSYLLGTLSWVKNTFQDSFYLEWSLLYLPSKQLCDERKTFLPSTLSWVSSTF